MTNWNLKEATKYSWYEAKLKKTVRSSDPTLKKTLAKEIIKCLGKDDFIFGGYVRHQVAGEDFNDIDIICHSKLN